MIRADVLWPCATFQTNWRETFSRLPTLLNKPRYSAAFLRRLRCVLLSRLTASYLMAFNIWQMPYCCQENSVAKKKLFLGPLVVGLRKSKGFTQAQLAAEMRTTQDAVSRWEKGTREVPRHALLRLGQLAGEPDCWDLWASAGLDREAVLRAFPEVSTRLPGVSQVVVQTKGARSKLAQKVIGKMPGAVAIPLLKDPAAAGTPRAVDPREVEEIQYMLPFDCPHPAETLAFHVIGDSMTPVLEEGDVVFVDMFECDQQKLAGKMVAARGPDGGVTIKWLRKQGTHPVLVPNHTSPRHPYVLLDEEEGWEVLGRVIASRREY
jgi:SOS-response transcriptional repressor LexA